MAKKSQEEIDFETQLKRRVVELAKSKGYSNSAFGNALGPGGAAFQKRLDEGGRNVLRQHEFADAARLLGVSIEYLITGKNPQITSSDPLSTGIVEVGENEFASLPRYEAQFSAGHGSLIDPNAGPIGHQLIEYQWLRTVTNAAPEHLAVVKVDGDSMETTLSDGDWVLLDRTQKRITREGIYALAVHDSCWIKRVSLNLRDKLVRVISDNDRYPVQELPEDELALIGRVLSVVWRKT